jgi:hypothetical protein
LVEAPLTVAFDVARTLGRPFRSTPLFLDALRDAGFRVVEAADGQEALQEALSRRVDLIVMDATMPEVDGLEGSPLVDAGSAGPKRELDGRR